MAAMVTGADSIDDADELHTGGMSSLFGGAYAPSTLGEFRCAFNRIALTAGVPRFSTHTTRHLCLTDLARMGWELHAIATFAGHRSTDATLANIHLSGRDLAEKLNRGMEQIHGWRAEMLARLGERVTGAVRL